ncbi:energy transducer TonB [Pseudoalteromonas sp. T1lg75]|uniref:energy transducer TonB n=1 Tax=Pseudoalteromonas sp. T1lg75 TaxID=2077102 RepID=UPI000CF62FCF|nr:energy transducer TonB [Pseudoalteromonas sp. T1lg75]
MENTLNITHGAHQSGTYEPGFEPSHNLIAPGFKAVAFALAAAAITLATFSFMVSLLTAEQRAPVEVFDDVIVEIMEPPKHTEVIKKTKPVPPKVEPRPQARPSLAAEPGDEVLTLAPTLPDVGTEMSDLGEFSSMSRDTAMPLVRVPPQYPATAAREGIEGYVILSYDISPTGQVINAKVISAEPKRIFDREALKALSKWKFSPKVVEGVARSQPNQQVRLDFNLQN